MQWQSKSFLFCELQGKLKFTLRCKEKAFSRASENFEHESSISVLLTPVLDQAILKKTSCDWHLLEICVFRGGKHT